MSKVAAVEFVDYASDTIGSKLLGHDPRRLPYLTLADGLLGHMDDVEIVGAGPRACPGQRS